MSSSCLVFSYSDSSSSHFTCKFCFSSNNPRPYLADWIFSLLTWSSSRVRRSISDRKVSSSADDVIFGIGVFLFFGFLIEHSSPLKERRSNNQRGGTTVGASSLESVVLLSEAMGFRLPAKCGNVAEGLRKGMCHPRCSGMRALCVLTIKEIWSGHYTRG